MEWYENLKTNAKILLGVGAMFLLLVAASVAGYNAIAGIRDTEREVVGRYFPVVEQMLELRSDLNRQRAAIQQMISSADRVEQERLEKDIRERTSEANATLQAIAALTRGDPDFERRLQELSAARSEYQEARSEQFRLIYAGKAEDARRMSLGTQSELYEKIRDIELALANNARDKAKDAVTSSELSARNAMRLFGIVVLAGFVLSVALIVALNRLISRPLVQVAQLAQRIAGGDLTATVPQGQRADEIGLLTRTFRTMSDSLREQIGALLEGTNVLGAAATEIVASTAQLASSASQSAASVSETTTTVEEVRQTAQLSSQKARAVSESAQKAAQISQTGRKSTEDVVTGMNRIRQQMDSIAASMMRLSEQGQAIGQIIATVEDLAVQSNLLAVNAAIEAAKAGEHGKGFGVVAQEVKSLAEQSRQATNQVRTILNEIQKATAAAVMAAEQGTKAVEAGAIQTSAAGESIQTLANSVAEASLAATQIAASSQQQLVGMDQVAQAMTSIKQATTQNVASAKQLESSARNLDELGRRIRQMVERYRI